MFQQITQTLSQFNPSTLTADNSSWFNSWLSNYLGDTAATAIQTTLTIVVNLIIAYVVVLQFFKILKGIENKNSADGAERTQAMATIKNAIIVIVLVTTVGAVGFNALLWLGGTTGNPTA